MFLKGLGFWFKLLLIVALLGFGDGEEALARRTGGRVGGGAIRTAPRSAPTRTGQPGGTVAPRGGGFGFPFLLPFFFTGGGFGSLFSVLIFMALLGFLLNVARSFANQAAIVPKVEITVAQVQVGLLAIARELQPELNQIARQADATTGMGRATLVQEVTLALLRHPQYWVYGATEVKIGDVTTAEAKFNQLALAQRSKFSEETLVNYDNQLTEKTNTVVTETDPGKYILVTIVIGVEGKLELAEVNGESDLRQALQQVGSVSSDRLIAIEILWTPQAEGDALTSDDLLEQYPNLKLI
ncbi:DUF1517 domain-containing protein [Gloeocapsa sp. PCC 73106]|uniref:DUF1517 domain-containing protein n=1 Tax=Gloeocapsa sp. PCC 73106 TaxID=102232 RepID=UPI0002ACB646|nr:DUF1517 domain-containing protein [Gloeocapsa sp. PCC 73106]ELR98886.1 putative membrane protein [Gloeocapsa sp. PCC 73106]